MLLLLLLSLNFVCLAKSNANSTTISSRQQLSLRNLCPYRKFCQSAPLKEIRDENYESCCEACSCEINCFKTGSCCPDMPMSGLADPKYPCRHLWHFGKGVAGLSGTSNNPDYWYHIIDECPDNTIALSYSRCKKPSKVQDYVLVTDIRTGEMYRNKHCAECNDILNYANLKIEMHCNDPFSISNLLSSEKREEYVMENCTLRSFPPEKRSNLSHCVPESRVTSSCNVTGSWDFYNKEIEERCSRNSYDQNKIFRQLSFSVSQIYDYFANVYCFLCNVDSNARKSDTCEIFDDVEGYKGFRIPFYVILDTDAWEQDPVEKEETRCHSTQIWDPFTESCRNLFCPQGQIPAYGSCKDLFSNINGYTLSIHFEVTMNYGNITSHDILLRYLKIRIFRELGSDITCRECRSTLFSGKKSASRMFIRYEMCTKNGCPYSTLLERIRQIAIKKKMYLQFKFRTQVIRVTMALVFEDIDRETGFNVLAESFVAFCNGVTIIDETILLFCPSVMLSNDEVREMKKNNAKFDFGIGYTNSTFQKVCIENYFSAKQANSAVAAVYCVQCCKMFMVFMLILLIQRAL